MKVKMLLKSGYGSIRHGDVVDAAQEDVRLTNIVRYELETRRVFASAGVAAAVEECVEV